MLSWKHRTEAVAVDIRAAPTLRSGPPSGGAQRPAGSHHPTVARAQIVAECRHHHDAAAALSHRLARCDRPGRGDQGKLRSTGETRVLAAGDSGDREHSTERSTEPANERSIIAAVSAKGPRH